jgi:hypothetical protein
MSTIFHIFERNVNMNWRQVLIRVGMVSAVALLAVGCMGTATDDRSGAEAPAATPAEGEAEFLLVQSAGASSLEHGILRLSGVSPSTVFFSDRPERIAGHVSTEQVVLSWGDGDDSFTADPPNATLSILAGAEPQEIVVVLTSPRFEEGDLVYDVEVLEGNDAALGAASSLFIDVIGRPLTPLSFAGATRRVARRTVRRR